MRKLASLLLPYFIIFLLLLSIFWFVLHGYNLNFKLPSFYSSDALFNAVNTKTIIDTGWYLTNPSLAYPQVFELYDYPTLDNFSYFIQKLLILGSSNPFTIIHLFYLLTYPLNAFAAMYVYKKLGLPSAYAVSAAVLFSILPYHFFRNEIHLYLSLYFSIPIWFMLAFSLFNEEPFLPYKNPYGYHLALLLLLCIIVNSGVYYTFFGLFYTLLAGVMAACFHQRWKPFLRSVGIISLSGIIALISLSPNFIYTHAHGKDHAVAQRGFAESEVFGLKITQLLLPIENHRIPSLAEMRKRYDKESAQVLPLQNNENISASLGTLGSLGFLFSLSLVLLQCTRKTTTHLYRAALFNLSGFVLATIAGLGTLIGMFLVPDIRAYNRISVFLGFLSLFVFFKMLGAFCQKYNYKPITMILISGLCLAFGIFDQTTTMDAYPKISPIQTDFHSDQVFVKQIEATLPGNSAVFELPYFAFPETPPINKLYDYELFRPYLHSNKLKWSYGSMQGRSAATWQATTASLLIPEMISTLVKSGFSGLMIDRNGYTDNGVLLEHALSQFLHEPPLQSPNGQLSFFILKMNS